MIYNIMLISGIHKSDLVICVYVYMCVYVYIFRLIFIISYYKMLNIVPCATQ